MIRGVCIGVMVAGACFAAPGVAAAACAGPLPGAPPAPAPAVSFIGVALSGPSAGSQLLTPGRLLVLRYLTGSGPRVVRLDTGVTPTTRVSERLRVMAGGTYYADPGGIGDRRRIPPRALITLSVCGPSQPVADPATVRPARPIMIRARDGTAWPTQLLRGPFGLRCLAVARSPVSTGDRRECERIARPDSAVAGVWRSKRGRGTLIAAQAPRLRSMTIVSPLGVRTVRARPGSRIAAAAYDRSMRRTDVRLRLRFAGGRERSLTPFGY